MTKTEKNLIRMAIDLINGPADNGCDKGVAILCALTGYKDQPGYKITASEWLELRTKADATG